MWAGFVGLISSALELFHNALGSWGAAIILFTVTVKLVTWPLNAKQVQSARTTQLMQPRLKAIQEKYKNDKELQQQEMMKLYKEMGTSPLGGCLPLLIQMPIWFALYRAIISLANAGELGERFLVLPTLACPSSTFAQCSDMGLSSMSWPLNVANLGATWPYLILPILTIVSQILLSRMMAPKAAAGATDDPMQATMKQMNTIMPLMFGVFALQFPAGLALYWVTNNVLTGLQYFLLNRSPVPTPALAAATVESPIVVDGTVRETLVIEGNSNAKPRNKGKRKKR